MEAVKALIAFYNHGEEPAEMPAFYRLSGEMVLVLSNKKNSYYVVTAKACSCPSFTYRGGPCKHQRKYFGAKPQSQPMPEMERGGFRPCLPEEEESKASSPIAEMLIDAYAFNTKPEEVEYWQAKQAQEA